LLLPQGLQNLAFEMGRELALKRSRAVPPRFGSAIASMFLVSIWCQITPTVPVLPIMPAYKSLSLHGMEEVIGSIPIRSTNFPLDISYLR
jgi:hypothetical protein